MIIPYLFPFFYPSFRQGMTFKEEWELMKKIERGNKESTVLLQKALRLALHLENLKKEIALKEKV